MDYNYICLHCFIAEVELVKGHEPYNIDHYQCPCCDSTYTFEEIERDEKSTKLE